MEQEWKTASPDNAQPHAHPPTHSGLHKRFRLLLWWKRPHCNVDLKWPEPQGPNPRKWNILSTALRLWMYVWNITNSKGRWKTEKKFSLANRIKTYLKSLTYKEVTQMTDEKKTSSWKTDDDNGTVRQSSEELIQRFSQCKSIVSQSCRTEKPNSRYLSN